jgi:predicted enzyme related to lactoylglutathione lyase
MSLKRRNGMDRVVHFEIPAEDLERAKKFYSEIFGWKLNQLGPEMGNYVLVHTGPSDEQGMPQEPAFINGGLMRRDPSATSPVLVMAVADAEQTVEKVKRSGGRLVGEILDIPGVGRYARVQDCEGNVIGVLKPTMP